MASNVGRVIEVEKPEDPRFANRSFGRARVEIDAEKPLVPGFVAPRSDDLEDVWVQIKYEKLVRFCFNCDKMGHESKACEEETVEFMVNGVARGYDASLCTQALKNQAPTGGNRNVERSPEKWNARMEGRSNYYGHGEVWESHISKEVIGGRRSQGIEERASGQHQWGPWHGDEGRSTEDGRMRQLVTFEPNQNREDASVLGQEKWAQLLRKEDWVSGLGDALKNMNGTNNLLKARREKLQKAQIKYWVDFEEEEEDGIKLSRAVVPTQTINIREIAEGLRDVTLKRKADDEPEAPLCKRRRDYEQDSPKSAGNRRKAEEELKRIAKTDG